MNKQTNRIIVISMLFSFVFGQKSLLERPISDYNGALRTQPKFVQSQQKIQKQLINKQLISKNSSIFWVEPRIRDDYSPPEYIDTERNVRDWCGTMPWWESRNSNQRSCDLYGVTDDPTVRDSYIPDANTDIKYIRLFIHAFADVVGDICSNTKLLQPVVHVLTSCVQIAREAALAVAKSPGKQYFNTIYNI